MTSVDGLPGVPWWRSAVIYQVYPRSFADESGDGIGDLPGLSRRLPELAELGVDAVWLSPFFRSPQRDAGYDVSDYCGVDPLFGTLDDFDGMQERAHDLGLRVIIDMVPNHTSSQHSWFQDALAAPPGSPERGHYIFRDGRGSSGELPPNNWQSVFGGPAWTRVTEADGDPGQWYLHLFDASQPDLDWTDPWVHERFVEILRFWLDRGVDGFRVDVAHGLAKAEGLPDVVEATDTGGSDGEAHSGVAPYWAQEGVHEIWREWREVVDSYPGQRVLCAEAWVDPLAKTALWVRPDEMHQAFNFPYLETRWHAESLREVIQESLDAFTSVGAPSTWVLSNHDVIRHLTRLSLPAHSPHGAGVGPLSPGIPDPAAALPRARAATALMLALPGSAYLYQGEELGLPEVTSLPDEARQDPTWFRDQGERYGRDGCRVPIPWEQNAPGCGFSPTGESWLPMPDDWARYARDVQRGDPTSTLELYRSLLRLRRERGLGTGDLEWVAGYGEGVLAFRNSGVLVIANVSGAPVPVPAGEVLLATAALDGGIAPDTTVWLA